MGSGIDFRIFWRLSTSHIYTIKNIISDNIFFSFGDFFWNFFARFTKDRGITNQNLRDGCQGSFGDHKFLSQNFLIFWQNLLLASVRKGAKLKKIYRRRCKKNRSADVTKYRFGKIDICAWAVCFCICAREDIFPLSV